LTPAQLDQVLTRFGLAERPAPTLEGLALFQRAQRMAVPFENLDIPMARGISLDPDTVFDKIVTRGRGGYCFEQNQLQSRALTALGFKTRPLLGRVWLFAGETIPPRTHVFNLVTLGGESIIADAGFGAHLAPPLRLGAVAVTAPDDLKHRIVPDERFGWMLQCDRGHGFEDLYSFTLDAVEAADIAMANHWTSTWPGSRFVQNVIASIILPHGMATLMNTRYARQNKSGAVESDITSLTQLQLRLSLVFGINLERDEVAALGLF